MAGEEESEEDSRQWAKGMTIDTDGEELNWKRKWWENGKMFGIVSEVFFRFFWSSFSTTWVDQRPARFILANDIFTESN